MAEERIIQKKLQKFSEEIMDIARNECESIQTEVEKDREQELAQYREQALSDSRKYLESECKEIDASVKTAVYEEKDRLRKELFALRETYKNNVFAQAAERIRDFAAGAEYPTFLQKAAGKLAEDASLAGATLLLRSEDMPHADAVKSVFGNCTIQADSGIVLGGIVAVSADGRKRVDLSLDSALEDQKTWFYRNSKLDITF